VSNRRSGAEKAQKRAQLMAQTLRGAVVAHPLTAQDMLLHTVNLFKQYFRAEATLDAAATQNYVPTHSSRKKSEKIKNKWDDNETVSVRDEHTKIFQKPTKRWQENGMQAKNQRAGERRHDSTRSRTLKRCII
jgi:cobalamin biosynthesis Mg chelatase CobN